MQCVQYVVCDQSRHLALSIWRYRFGGASTERGIGVEHLPMTIKTVITARFWFSAIIMVALTSSVEEPLDLEVLQDLHVSI